MSLYLSSYRIPTPETVFSMIPVTPGEAKMAIITNAKDYRARGEARIKLDLLSEDLARIGFKNTTELDLMDYSGQDKDLSKEFDKFDVLYCAGGDSYALRYAMKKSEFDRSIQTFLKGGGMYIGESAGAFAVGCSLIKGDQIDGVSEAPEIFYDGANLVDKVVIPHADNAYYRESVKSMQDYYESSNIPYISLNDNQSLVVDNDGNEFVETGRGTR